MKRRVILRALTGVMACVLMTMALCSCGSKKGEIENLMTEFEYSCNELDIDAMLDCIDPAISDKIKLATGIASMFTDKDSDEMIESLVGMLTGDTTLNAKDFFSSIKISTEDIKTKKEAGTANALVEYNIAGSNFKKEAVFEYVYKTGKWYIAKFSFK